MRGGVTQLMAVELINVHLVICMKKVGMLQLKVVTRQEYNTFKITTILEFNTKMLIPFCRRLKYCYFSSLAAYHLYNVLYVLVAN